MIISRTPYRVSFFGGGTDYHSWYQEHGGAVLSTSIDHYAYLTCRFLPPFFEHKSRIVWTKTEEVQDHSEIQHPAVKAILEYLEVERGIEISHQGGLPARSGLGSSSTFAVGLLNAIYALRGMMSTSKQLACEAVHIEREMIKENVGVQDQISAAYGGFNKITIHPDGNFDVDPVILPALRLENLQDHMLLFFTGVSRTASEIAGNQIKASSTKQRELKEMQGMVDIALDLLVQGNDVKDFGRLLNESWKLKRSLSDDIAPDFVDEIYQTGIDAGALGGKLLGAGGGGFMLFFAPPEKHEDILKALSELLVVPFEFETGGSQIIFYDKPKYSRTSMLRRDYMHLGNLAEAREDIKLGELNKKRKSKLTVI
jgi:D-glycero-alpha-D-manno-heptose-7-phosphate kinase